MKPLIEDLPQHYQRSPQDAELQRVLHNLVERVEQDLEFTLAQLIPSTASWWGLELWEAAYGIPTDYTQGTQQRRTRVLAKIQGTGTSTQEKIKGIAQVFSTFPVEIAELHDQYHFVIWYVGTTGEVEHKADLVAAINEVKPAHLAWTIGYRETCPTSVYVGCLPRQGDKNVWKVDCRDPKV